MSEQFERFAGGCLCGRVRFEVDGALLDAGWCHCRICQRSSGAPALAWATFAKPAFAYTQGRPASYRSSDHAVREFCDHCGTPMVFRDDHQDDVSVNVGTFDAPEAFPPRLHIWMASRVPWFDPDDGLPRHEHGGPPSSA